MSEQAKFIFHDNTYEDSLDKIEMFTKYFDTEPRPIIVNLNFVELYCDEPEKVVNDFIDLFLVGKMNIDKSSFNTSQ